MTEFATAAPVAKPRVWTISARVTRPGSRLSRSWTARCRPGSSDVIRDATAGLVQEAAEMAWSKTTASFAKDASAGVVSRAYP